MSGCDEERRGAGGGGGGEEGGGEVGRTSIEPRNITPHTVRTPSTNSIISSTGDCKRKRNNTSPRHLAVVELWSVRSRVDEFAPLHAAPTSQAQQLARCVTDEVENSAPH